MNCPECKDAPWWEYRPGFISKDGMEHNEPPLYICYNCGYELTMDEANKLSKEN